MKLDIKERKKASHMSSNLIYIKDNLLLNLFLSQLQKFTKKFAPALRLLIFVKHNKCTYNRRCLI